jgi:thiamine-monophosphate kinase
LKHKESALGIGDDAAVLDNEMSQVVSTDLLVEGVHFDLTYTPLMHLGYKAVVVSVSDICAMNAIPKQLFISIAVSSKYTLEALEELYKGINAACEKYNLDFVGGDTSSAVSGLTISSTVIGTTQQDNVVKRSGAKEGNLLCVSGDLGGAYVGLQILEREKSVFKDQPNMQPDLAAYDYIIGRQLRPEARIDVIELLEELKLKPTSMIDISDGLSSEIFHLCKASNVGMKLFEDKLPIDQQTYDTALSLNLAPTTCALNGGEDYELAFTLDQSSFEKVKNSPDISIVGYCTAAHEGKTIVTKSENVLELEAQGWQSFS